MKIDIMSLSLLEQMRAFRADRGGRYFIIHEANECRTLTNRSFTKGFKTCMEVVKVKT